MLGNPESKTVGVSWSVFNALLGWTNNATVGTILAYVFYWLAIIAALVYMKWSEGRMSFFGRLSNAGQRRLARRQAAATAVDHKLKTASSFDDHKSPAATPLEEKDLESTNAGAAPELLRQ